MIRPSGLKGLVIVMLAVWLLNLTGCAKPIQPAQQPLSAAQQQETLISKPFEVVQQVAERYLKETRPLFISAREVYEKVIVSGDQGYVIVDVRADEHYAYAHIPGAIHISYADIWRENKLQNLPRDKKLVVVCYSGHTASQTAAYWGMLGFDAIAMQNGMAGWTKDKDAIGASPMACSPNEFPTVAGVTHAGEFGLPGLAIKATNTAEVLMKQGSAIVDRPVVVQAKDVKDKLGTDAFYVIDIRSSDHFQRGHIQGAVNIPFRQLADSASLKKIPTDKQVVVVCYDGHASSQAARILNLAGYQATALKDGMSVWTGNESIIGGRAIACNLDNQPVVKLNAALKPSGSAPAT